MQRQRPHGVNRLHAGRARAAPRCVVLSTVDIIECDERSLVVLEAHHRRILFSSARDVDWLNSLTNRQDCQEVVSSVRYLIEVSSIHKPTDTAFNHFVLRHARTRMPACRHAE